LGNDGVAAGSERQVRQKKNPPARNDPNEIARRNFNTGRRESTLEKQNNSGEERFASGLFGSA
jgi:hypothetical protein